MTVLLAMTAALLIGLTAWWQANSWYEDHLLTEERVEIQNRVVQYGNNLTTEINQRFAALEGLAAFARTYPTKTELDARFEDFAAGLYTASSGIRALQLFPIDGYERVYPTVGNEAVVGRTFYDLVNDERPNVRVDVQRTLDTGKIATSGPYELRQGGMGFIARLAVYNNEELWGLVVTILDMQPLLESTDLAILPDDIELALRDKNNDDQILLGDGSVFSNDPVIFTVSLPEGSWQLAAIPAGSWAQAISEPILVFEAAGLLLVVLLALLTALFANRQLSLRQRVQEQSVQLVETRSLYRQLFDGNSDALFVLDETGHIVDASQLACDRYGYTRQELLAMTASNLAIKELTPQAPSRINAALKEPIRFTWQHQRRDGTTFPVEINARPISLEGKPHILSSVRDITQRTQDEKRLSRIEESLSLAVQAANVGLWSWDLDTNDVYFSPQWKSQLGYEDHEIPNEFAQWEQRVHPDDLEAALQNIQMCIANADPRFSNEFRLQHRDGSYRHIFAQATLFMDENGKPNRMAGSHIDITDRIATEKALLATEKRFRALVEQSITGIYVIGADRYVYVNRRFAEMFGYTEQEILENLAPTCDRSERPNPRCRECAPANRG